MSGTLYIDSTSLPVSYPSTPLSKEDEALVSEREKFWLGKGGGSASYKAQIRLLAASLRHQIARIRSLHAETFLITHQVKEIVKQFNKDSKVLLKDCASYEKNKLLDDAHYSSTVAKVNSMAPEKRTFVPHEPFEDPDAVAAGARAFADGLGAAGRAVVNLLKEVPKIDPVKEREQTAHCSLPTPQNPIDAFKEAAQCVNIGAKIIRGANEAAIKTAKEVCSITPERKQACKTTLEYTKKGIKSFVQANAESISRDNEDSLQRAKVFCGLHPKGKTTCESSIDFAKEAVKPPPDLAKKIKDGVISTLESCDGSSLAPSLIAHKMPEKEAKKLAQQVVQDGITVGLATLPVGTFAGAVKTGAFGLAKGLAKNGAKVSSVEGIIPAAKVKKVIRNVERKAANDSRTSIPESMESRQIDWGIEELKISHVMNTDESMTALVRVSKKPGFESVKIPNETYSGTRKVISVVEEIAAREKVSKVYLHVDAPVEFLELALKDKRISYVGKETSPFELGFGYRKFKLELSQTETTGSISRPTLKEKIHKFIENEAGTFKLPAKAPSNSKDMIKLYQQAGWRIVKGRGKGSHTLMKKGEKTRVIQNNPNLPKAAKKDLFKVLKESLETNTKVAEGPTKKPKTVYCADGIKEEVLSEKALKVEINATSKKQPLFGEDLGLASPYASAALDGWTAMKKGFLRVRLNYLKLPSGVLNLFTAIERLKALAKEQRATYINLELTITPETVNLHTALAKRWGVPKMILVKDKLLCVYAIPVVKNTARAGKQDIPKLVQSIYEKIADQPKKKNLEHALEDAHDKIVFEVIPDFSHLRKDPEEIWLSALGHSPDSPAPAIHYYKSGEHMVAKLGSFVVKDSIDTYGILCDLIGHHLLRSWEPKHVHIPRVMVVGRYRLKGELRLFIIKPHVPGESVCELLQEMALKPLKSLERQLLDEKVRQAIHQSGKAYGEMHAKGAGQERAAGLWKRVQARIEDFLEAWEEANDNLLHAGVPTINIKLADLEWIFEEFTKAPGEIVFGFGKDGLPRQFIWKDSVLGFVDAEGVPLCMNLAKQPLAFAADECSIFCSAILEEGLRRGLLLSEASAFRKLFRKGYHSTFIGKITKGSEQFFHIYRSIERIRDLARNGAVDHYTLTALVKGLNREIREFKKNYAEIPNTYYFEPPQPKVIQPSTRSEKFVASVDEILKPLEQELNLALTIQEHREKIYQAIPDLAHLNLKREELWLRALPKKVRKSSVKPKMQTLQEGDMLVTKIETIPNYVVKDMGLTTCFERPINEAMGARFLESLKLKKLKTSKFVAIVRYGDEGLFVLKTHVPGTPYPVFFERIGLLPKGSAKREQLVGKVCKRVYSWGEATCEVHAKGLELRKIPTASAVESQIAELEYIVDKLQELAKAYGLKFEKDGSFSTLCENYRQHPGYISHILGRGEASNFVWSKKYGSVGFVDAESAVYGLDVAKKPTHCSAAEVGECLQGIEKAGRAMGLSPQEITLFQKEFMRGYYAVFPEAPAFAANHFFEVLHMLDWTFGTMQEMALEGILNRSVFAEYLQLATQKIKQGISSEAQHAASALAKAKRKSPPDKPISPEKAIPKKARTSSIDPPKKAKPKAKSANRLLTAEEVYNFVGNFEYQMSKKWVLKAAVIDEMQMKAHIFYQKLARLKKGRRVRIQFVHDSAKAFGCTTERMLAKPKGHVSPSSQDLIAELQRRKAPMEKVEEITGIAQEELYRVVNLNQGAFNVEQIRSLLNLICTPRAKVHLLAAFASLKVDMLAFVDHFLGLKYSMNMAAANNSIFAERANLHCKLQGLKGVMDERKLEVSTLSRKAEVGTWKLESILKGSKEHASEWPKLLSALEVPEEDLLLRGFFNLSDKHFAEFRQCEKLLKEHLEKNNMSLGAPERWNWYSYKFYVGIKQLWARTALSQVTEDSITALIAKIGLTK